MNISFIKPRVLCPSTGRDQLIDVHLQSGTICALGDAPEGFKPDQIIDANGFWLTPSLVDGWGHVGLRGAQPSAKEVKAAKTSGLYTLYVPPSDALCVDSKAKAQRVMSELEDIRVIPIGALTEQLNGKQVADLSAMAQAGCRVFTNGYALTQDLKLLRHVYQYASGFDLKVVIVPIEPSLNQGVMHEGETSNRLGLSGTPYACETTAIAQHLALIEDTQIRAHFTHVTCAQSVDLIEQAQEKGLNVTASTTLAHCHLTCENTLQFDPSTHLRSVLRETQDLNRLREGLQKGILQSLCSDHTPLTKVQKHAPFAQSEPGLSAYDTFLGLSLKLVHDGVIEPLQWASLISSGPLTQYDETPYAIQVGQVANLVLIDPLEAWSVVPNHFESEGLYSPFVGWHLKGRVLHGFSNGQKVG